MRISDWSSDVCSSDLELGYEIALPQFRAIALRSGTPPERVKILSDALAQVAASPDYKKFLEAPYAREDSFMGADQAQDFIKKQLEEDQKHVVQGTSVSVSGDIGGRLNSKKLTI